MGEERTDDLAKSKSCLRKQSLLVGNHEADPSIPVGRCQFSLGTDMAPVTPVKNNRSLLPHRSNCDGRSCPDLDLGIRVRIVSQLFKRAENEIEGTELPSDVSNATDLCHQSEVVVMIQSRFPYYSSDHFEYRMRPPCRRLTAQCRITASA